ncbi:hypothetical protein [Psychromonas sp.]|uniref:hypothetical protein n=1 Tax=Psychromonas sp. TaxID=1884585 RepID=UPI0039E4F07C
MQSAETEIKHNSHTQVDPIAKTHSISTPARKDCDATSAMVARLLPIKKTGEIESMLLVALT